MDENRKGAKKEEEAEGGGETGAGAEAAEGLHSAGGRAPEERSAADRTTESDAPGSEPLQDREDNPKGSYGGEGGKPRQPPPSA